MAFVEDLAPYLADFGTDATIGAATVRGIFDAAYAEALGMAGTQPAFLCAAASVSAVTVGTALTINATSYTVAEIKPDGTGMTRLLLESA